MNEADNESSGHACRLKGYARPWNHFIRNACGGSRLGRFGWLFATDWPGQFTISAAATRRARDFAAAGDAGSCPGDHRSSRFHGPPTCRTQFRHARAFAPDSGPELSASPTNQLDETSISAGSPMPVVSNENNTFLSPQAFLRFFTGSRPGAGREVVVAVPPGFNPAQPGQPVVSSATYTGPKP